MVGYIEETRGVSVLLHTSNIIFVADRMYDVHSSYNSTYIYT
jgi:hypothetical protein